MPFEVQRADIAKAQASPVADQRAQTAFARVWPGAAAASSLAASTIGIPENSRPSCATSPVLMPMRKCGGSSPVERRDDLMHFARALDGVRDTRAERHHEPGARAAYFVAAPRRDRRSQRRHETDSERVERVVTEPGPSLRRGHKIAEKGS